MSLCSRYEDTRVSSMLRSDAARRWRARPLFERLAIDEEHWRVQGEDAIKFEMESRVIAWLLVKGQA